MQKLQNRTVYLLLIGFLVVHFLSWSLGIDLARSVMDSKGDMIENYAWGKELQLGYYKHPPLFAWVSYLWLNTFGVTNLSYFMLSQANVVLGMVFIFLIVRSLKNAQIALIAVLFLELMPFYNTLGIKFNANSILLSLYPVASFFFIRCLKHNKNYDWALLAITGALCMLAKYSSVCLLLTFFIIMLRFYRHVFAGYKVYLCLLVFVICLLPHALWFVNNNYLPLEYLDENNRPGLVSKYPFKFLGSQFFYLLPVFVFALLVSRKKNDDENDAANDDALAGGENFILIKHLTFAPTLIMFALSLMFNLESSSVWGIPNWFLFTAYLLFLREVKNWKLVACCVVAINAFIVLYGVYVNVFNIKNKYNNIPVKSIVLQIEDDWNAQNNSKNNSQCNNKILYAVGDKILTQTFIFYSKSHPSNLINFDYKISPWILPQHNKLCSVVLCEISNAECNDSAKKYFSNIPYVEKTMEGFGIKYFIPK